MQGVIEFLPGSAAAEGLKYLLRGDAFYEIQLRGFGGTLFCTSELPNGSLLFVGSARLEECLRFFQLLDAYIRSCRVSLLQRRKFEDESRMLGRYAAFKYEFRKVFLGALAIAN